MGRTAFEASIAKRRKVNRADAAGEVADSKAVRMALSAAIDSVLSNQRGEKA